MLSSHSGSRPVAASRTRRTLRLAICTCAALAMGASSASAQSIVVKSGDGPLNTPDPNVQVLAGSTSTPAFIITPDSDYAPAIATSRWIGQSTWPAAYQSVRYTTTFALPANAISPTLTVRVHADNRAALFLNGHPIGTQPGDCPSDNFRGAPEVFTSTTWLMPGANTLAFDVTNCEGPAGLDFYATIDYQQPPVDAALDAFKCWTVSPGDSATHLVGLSDLFGSASASVFEGRQICNPVRMTLGGATTPVVHPEAHLTCRRAVVKPRTPGKTVRLRNQLGTFIAQTGATQTLCIPSLQRIVPDRGIATPPTGTVPEADLDHFRCYDLQPMSATAATELLDDFGQSSTTVTQLVRLCNPVEKTYQGMVTPIRRPQLHLACFTISDAGPNPPSGWFYPLDVVVRNQFGIAGMHVESVESLCLPTLTTVLDLSNS